MQRNQKAEKVAEIKALFENSGAFFLTDYQGLDVPDMTQLRKELRENNVRYMVAKNTLFKRAAGEAGVDGLEEHFTGPTAVAFAADDPSVAAKILHESNKKKDLPRFKVFMMEGQLHQPEEVKALAELPPRDILLAQVVASVEAPFTELIGSLDGFFRELIGLVDALAEQKKGEAA